MFLKDRAVARAMKTILTCENQDLTPADYAQSEDSAKMTYDPPVSDISSTAFQTRQH